MQRFTISLTVAIFIGLAAAQTPTTTQATATPSTPSQGFGGMGFGNYAADWTKYQGMQSKFLDQSSKFQNQFLKSPTDYAAQNQQFTDMALQSQTNATGQLDSVVGDSLNIATLGGANTQDYYSAYLGNLGGFGGAAPAQGSASTTVQSGAAIYSKKISIKLLFYLRKLNVAANSPNPYIAFEQEEEALENDFYFREQAWRQAQKLAEQAILNKYNSDVAALATNTSINATDVANLTATLKTNYDQQRLEIRGNFTEQIAQSKFKFNIERDEIRLIEKEVLLNRTQEVTQSFLSTLPNETQQLIVAEQKKEKDILVKARVEKRVAAYAAEFAKTTANRTAEFQAVLTQAATDLGCNSTCVSQCAATSTDYTNQTVCIDQCLCYYDSLVRFPVVVANATANVTANATAVVSNVTTNATIVAAGNTTVPAAVVQVLDQVVNQTNIIVNNSTLSPYIPPAIADIINKALGTNTTADATVTAPVVDTTVTAPVVDTTVATPVVDTTISTPVVDITAATPVVDTTVATPVVDATIAIPTIVPVVDATVAPVVDAIVAPAVVTPTLVEVVQATVAPVVDTTVASVVDTTVSATVVADASVATPLIVIPTVDIPSVAAPTIVETLTQAAVNATVGATQTLFSTEQPQQQQMTQKNSNLITLNLIVLGLVLVSMIGTAIYLSTDEKKKSKYYNSSMDEENSLNEYILLKP